MSKSLLVENISYNEDKGAFVFEEDEKKLCTFMSSYVANEEEIHDKSIEYLISLVENHEVFSDLKRYFEITDVKKLVDYLVIMNEIYKRKGSDFIPKSLGERLYSGHFYGEEAAAAILILRDVVIRNKIIRDSLTTNRKIRIPKVRTDRSICINLQEKLKENENCSNRVHYVLHSAYPKNFNAKKAALVSISLKGETRELVEMCLYSIEENGCLIIEVDKIENMLLCSLIDMLSRCFGVVEIMKPDIFTMKSSTSYIVCQDFIKPLPKKERKNKDNSGSEKTKELIDTMLDKNNKKENLIEDENLEIREKYIEYLSRKIKNYNLNVSKKQQNAKKQEDIMHDVNKLIYAILQS
jgi:hypothetical protein